MYSTPRNDKTPQYPPTHPVSDSAARRVCMRNDCPFVIPDDRCKKSDCCVEPRPLGCPTDSGPLHRCTEVASMAGQEAPDTDGIDWAAFDLKERSDQQATMRRHIAAVEVTA